MKRFARGVFIAFTILAIITYVLACSTPYISPIIFWPMTFLGLGFLFIALGFLLLVMVWLLVRPKVALILLIIFLIAGYKNLHATFAFNFSTSFQEKKAAKTLRVITWNVRYFDNNDKAADSSGAVRRQMIDFLKRMNADVMFFQDYVDYYSEQMYLNKEVMQDSLGFKYYYTSKDNVFYPSYGKVENGVAIYSKYPLTDTGKIEFDSIPESIAHADVKFENKTIRLFTTHLLSMGIHPSLELKTKRPGYDTALVYGKSVTKRLKHYDQVHVKQALLYRKQIEQSPYPVIVSGDLNSVPSSYVYHTIKGNLQDVFIEKGAKVGHTYFALSRTLRIDYIFADPAFKVMQTTTPKLFLSDHFPVVADLQWR